MNSIVGKHTIDEIGILLLGGARRILRLSLRSVHEARPFAGQTNDFVQSNLSKCGQMSGWKSACSTASSIHKQRPELDFDFLLDDANVDRIEDNVRARKGVGNVHRVRDLWARIQQFSPFTAQKADDPAQLRELWDQFYDEAAKLPNICEEAVPRGGADAARCVDKFGGDAKISNIGGNTAEKLVHGWHSLLYPRAGSGARSYALIGSLAKLESALLDYAFDFLHTHLQHEQGIARVEPVDVDDILPISTTRACGLQQQAGQSPIQYRVLSAHDALDCPINEVSDDDGFCLSGTAEMGIADKLKSCIFDERDLPIYCMAQSRCFRPEVSSGAMDTGLYRVHEFNKIELFAVCTEGQSQRELERIVRVQRALLASLELHFRILDMPSEELGAPAARKFDIEAWMGGRRAWGELASASNCTDFQARRLHIKYRPSDGGPLRFVHTCNGTGLASTRTLIALLETHQTKHRKGLNIPTVLRQRMSGERTRGIRVQPANEIKYNFG